MGKEYIDLLEFLPESVVSQSGKKFPLKVKHDSGHLYLSYVTHPSLGGFREYNQTISRYVSKSLRTFEVLGLLQAEMRKTPHGILSFCNHEYRLVNHVLNWFEKELDFPVRNWRWSIKVNINKPEDIKYKGEIENELIKYWLRETPIILNNAYPKKVTYIKNTKNKLLRYHDYGSLILNHRNNLLNNVLQNFLKEITYGKIIHYDINLIRAYMKGIIAGEGCVQHNIKTGHYTVHISASNKEE